MSPSNYSTPIKRSQGVSRSYPSRRTGALTLALLPLLASSLPLPSARAQQQTKAPLRQPTSRLSAASGATLLTYSLVPGKTSRYHVEAFFTGHFPPFAQPDGPPIRLKADLVYAATTGKITPGGTEVSFAVESEDISLLEEDPDANLNIDPAKAISLSLPIEDVKKTLDATAVLRPDGSLVRVASANSKAAVKINFGIDVRKLFLLLMPVTFSKQAVKLNDTWTFEDGLLGRNPGMVTYRGQLNHIVSKTGEALSYLVGQTATAKVNDKIDKDGNSPLKPADAVGSVTGIVTTEGIATYSGLTSQGKTPPRIVRAALIENHLTLNAQLKQIAPDPEHPDKMLTTNIDVKGHLIVELAHDKPAPVAPASAAR